MKTDGGGGGKRVVEMEGPGWCPRCRPLASCRRRPVVVPYGRRGVVVVPGVNELGWDDLGTGDAHRSSFGCHVAPSDVAPASLVSVGRLCVCARPFGFVLGSSSLLRRSCSWLVVMWPWLLRGVRWRVSEARWGSSGWKGRLLGTHKNDDDERQVVVHHVWLPRR